MPALKTNCLYYGDNLEILRRYLADETVDLIYLDPPFNSNRSYNVLFKEREGAVSEAQLEAFEDTWHWEGAAETYEDMLAAGPPEVARILAALVQGLGHNDVTAYLTMMAIRVVELRRVLKPTGAIFLHCDPTAGPYLRVLMDATFGPRNFVNEIVWKRFSSHGNVARAFGKIHDTILFYRKDANQGAWNQLHRPLSDKYVEDFFTHVEADTGRRYRLQNVLNPNKDRPNLTYDWNGHTRVWKWTKGKMKQLHDAGLLEYSRRGLVKGFKQYLDDSPGEKLQDVWDDIRPLGQSGDKNLGYNTQKPLALLERIISSASSEGNIVLDPFCGCGTAIHAAHKLGRRWIGIDVTHLAINVMRRRMQDAFAGLTINVVGEPKDLTGAMDLAQRDKFQFQWWVLDRINALPVAGKKRGMDRGVDGVMPFLAELPDKYARALVSVKGGEQVGPAMIRDLKGVLDREGEPIGIFITLAKPTREMKREAASGGIYMNDFWRKRYARLQILTVEDILSGRLPDLPPARGPYTEASREPEPAKQLRLA